MRALLINALLIGTALTLSSCGKQSKAEQKIEKGQVVATVDGKDITIYELNAELQGQQLPTGPERKKIEQITLQRIIDRKILADIAKERGLDKTPDYLLQSRRANDALLVSLLQQDTAGKTPPASDEDAEKFIADNPSMFANRKILIIDQIQFPIPRDPAQLKAFEPLKTLEDIEQKLISDGVDYRRVPTSIDTMQIAPQMSKSIMDLPPGEVFVVPVAGAITANKITDVRNSPLAGQEAMDYAKMMVRKRRMGQKATNEFEPLVKAARAKVVYQDGYAPPKAPTKPAASAPAN